MRLLLGALGLAVLGGSAVLLAAFLTPAEQAWSVWPAVLINLGTTLLILIPVYVIERQLSRRIEVVRSEFDTAIRDLTVDLKGSLEGGIRDAMWNEVMEAENRFKSDKDVGAVLELLRLGSKYSLYANDAITVPLPAARSTWLCLTTATPTELTEVYGKNGGSIPEEGSVLKLAIRSADPLPQSKYHYFHTSDETLSSVVTETVTQPLLAVSGNLDAARVPGEVSDGLGLVLLQALKQRVKITPDPRQQLKRPGSLISAPSHHWMITDLGIVRTRGGRRLHARSLWMNRLWPGAWGLDPEEAKSYSSTWRLARAMGVTHPTAQGWWTRLLKEPLNLVLLLAWALPTALLTWLANFAFHFPSPAEWALAASIVSVVVTAVLVAVIFKLDEEKSISWALPVSILLAAATSWLIPVVPAVNGLLSVLPGHWLPYWLCLAIAGLVLTLGALASFLIDMGRRWRGARICAAFTS